MRILLLFLIAAIFSLKFKTLATCPIETGKGLGETCADNKLCGPLYQCSSAFKCVIPTGAFKIGVTCTADADCVNTLSPTPFGVPTLYCLGAAGAKTCKYKVLVGDACDTDDDCYMAGTYGFKCTGSKCVTKATTGQNCTLQTDCELSNFCLDNLCAPLKLLGETCTSTGACAYPNYCGTTSLKCEAPKAEGVACANVGECQAGLLCDTTCKKFVYKNIGDDCDAMTKLCNPEQSMCISSKCTATKTCGSDTDCVGWSCDCPSSTTGTCKNPGVYGCITETANKKDAMMSCLANCLKLNQNWNFALLGGYYRAGTCFQVCGWNTLQSNLMCCATTKAGALPKYHFPWLECSAASVSLSILAVLVVLLL
jgi:hypothetical protein